MSATVGRRHHREVMVDRCPPLQEIQTEGYEMGWGTTYTLKLHVSGEDHTTIGWISDTLTALEYAYNVAATAELFNQGYVHDELIANRIASVFQQARGFGFATGNLLLREFIPPDAQAQVVELAVGNSVDIGLDGLGDPIKQLRKTFDPIDRKGRKEDNRHTAAMNQHVEEMNATEREAKRKELHTSHLQRFAEFLAYLETVKFPFDEETAIQMKQNLAGEYFRAITSVEGNEIRVIEGPVAE